MADRTRLNWESESSGHSTSFPARTTGAINVPNNANIPAAKIPK